MVVIVTPRLFRGLLLLGILSFSTAGNVRRHRRTTVQVSSNEEDGAEPEAPTAAPFLLEEEDRDQLVRELQNNQNSLFRCPGKVTHFALYNAETDTYLRDVHNGDSICQMDFPVNLEAIVKECSHLPVESVKFKGSFDRWIENIEPYFAFGDDPDGDVWGNELDVGRYSLEAIPFARDSARGKRGERYRAEFTVVDCASPDPFESVGAPNRPPETASGAPPPGTLTGTPRPGQPPFSSVVNATSWNAKKLFAGRSTLNRRRAQTKGTSSSTQSRLGPKEFDFIYAGFLINEDDTWSLNGKEAVVSTACNWIAADDWSMPKIRRQLDNALFDLAEMEQDNGSNRLLGLHCAEALLHPQTWTRLEKHSPHATVLIHLRHPLLLWTSEDDEMGVGWGQLQYMLMALGKTELLVRDLRDLAEYSPDTVIGAHNDFSIILTTDGSDSSDDLWWKETVGGLTLPKVTEPSTMPPICHARYMDLRASLLESSAKTATWIRAHFLKSSQVYASPHFLKQLQTWKQDPCVTASETN